MVRVDVADNGIGIPDGVRGEGVRHLPAPARPRRVRGHRHRPGARQEGRRVPRRHDRGWSRRRCGGACMSFTLPLPRRRCPMPETSRAAAHRDPARRGRPRRRADDAGGVPGLQDRQPADRRHQRRGRDRLPAQAGPVRRRRRRPDLVLLDLNLPRRDGREVLRDIKGDPELRRIPVVVLTTSDAEEDVLAVLRPARQRLRAQARRLRAVRRRRARHRRLLHHRRAPSVTGERRRVVTHRPPTAEVAASSISPEEACCRLGAVGAAGLLSLRAARRAAAAATTRAARPRRGRARSRSSRRVAAARATGLPARVAWASTADSEFFLALGRGMQQAAARARASTTSPRRPATTRASTSTR